MSYPACDATICSRSDLQTPPDTPAHRSEDNHFFYSYDGEWKNGRMHGWGTYKFADGHTYKVGLVLSRDEQGYCAALTATVAAAATA